ncbi:MAG: anthranilate phosphoribosyltransferase [Candidatus Hydrogenedentota bacterium]|uniref:Anthranilate phosphoribosyltransferase n=1 Tax=Sumerlaea chitinivorans TaxID=2250252 RepID=A0A2Z4Y6H2_SUMC1|nr:Anthranilate phosphoribosyltransferase [Candidatus Sumerlaea chitinivorans]RMH29661.1 MAG: anthranilate phosphoribosyltransferase [Candidatus Hydrogenedentota bacterium]GIX44010.1 MAG: anthranilate phosphoribosyltransferase [Candidatus Sumerlaea sp.]
MNLTPFTRKIMSGDELSQDEARQVAEALLSGETSPVQTAAFLTALHMRGERLGEVVAFAEILRARAAKFDSPSEPILDTCGTGGDHAGTFNISTTAAFIAAGAGVRVAKHGNRSVTSQCGSADVLQALGINITCPQSVMERALREIGICFLFAPQYHSSMRHVADVRRELGFRTIFNLLGPLLNPARAQRQLIGVYSRSIQQLYAESLRALGTERALVVHSDDGMDEISTCAPTRVIELRDGRIETFVVDPAEFGIPRAESSDLAGGDVATNASTVEKILRGEGGPKSDIALVNAAAAIYVGGLAASIAEGLSLAKRAIENGAAWQKLEALREITKG